MSEEGGRKLSQSAAHLYRGPAPRRPLSPLFLLSFGPTFHFGHLPRPRHSPLPALFFPSHLNSHRPISEFSLSSLRLLLSPFCCLGQGLRRPKTREQQGELATLSLSIGFSFSLFIPPPHQVFSSYTSFPSSSTSMCRLQEVDEDNRRERRIVLLDVFNEESNSRLRSVEEHRVDKRFSFLFFLKFTIWLSGF